MNKAKLATFCLVSFVLVTVLINSVVLKNSSIFIHYKGRDVGVGGHDSSYMFYEQYYELFPNPLLTNVPKLPPSPPIDWNWMNYLEHTNHSQYTFTYYMNTGGFTVRIRCMLGTFYHALLLNRTFIVDYIDTTHRVQGSVFGNFTQFFLPVHSSKYLEQKVPGGAVTVSGNAAVPVPKDAPHVVGEAGFCPGEWISPQGKTQNLRAAGLRLWRFNEETTYAMEQILSRFPEWSTRKYHSIHIRRGDKVFGKWKEADYIPTERYLESLERLVGGEVTDPVYVASESEINIKEVREARPNWTVWSIPANHLRAGNFSTVEYEKAPYEYRMKMTYLLLAELTMLRYSHHHVCTWSSNVSELMVYLRPESSPKVFVIDLNGHMG